jgi:hypothetical protein
VGAPAEEDPDAMQQSPDQAAARTAAASAAADAEEAGGAAAAAADVKSEPQPGDGPGGVGQDAGGDTDACNGVEKQA